MVIIGLLSSIGAAKVLDTDSAAKKAALKAAVSDLNSRERLSWSQIKMSTDNWVDDDQVFAIVETEIGPGYQWESVGSLGGSLQFKGQVAAISRTPSTSEQPAVWQLN